MSFKEVIMYLQETSLQDEKDRTKKSYWSDKLMEGNVNMMKYCMKSAYRNRFNIALCQTGMHFEDGNILSGIGSLIKSIF